MKKKEKRSKAKSPDTAKKRKKADEKLHHEEQRFRVLIEHSSDIIVILNLEGTITYINPAVKRVLGFKAEERIGAKGFELIHPDDLKFVADSFNTLARDTNSPVIKTEVRLRHKDGSWRTLEAVGSNLINNNVVETVIVNYRDITEQKKAEEKLRYQEQRFRTFVENSSDIIAILNQEGIIIYENQAVERSLGLKTEERIGASLFDRIHPDDLKFACDAFNKFTMNPSYQDINSPVRQIRLRHRDGNWRTFESTGIKLLHDNIIEGVVINLRDITERRRAEEELKESEERFRLLSEAAFEAIAIHEEGVLLNANDQYSKMFGYEPDEALGKEMISVTFAPEVLEFVKKQVATDSLEPYESIGVRKDGTRFPMEICARKMEYKGRIVRFGAIRDLTERKRVEEELRESEANYRQLYNSSPAGIYRIDFKNGKFLKANDVFCEYLGCRQEEIISLNPHDILTEESNKLFLERVGKMALGIEVPMAVEYEISNKKGKQLYLQLNNKYIYDTEGYVVAADVVAHDITERKLVEDVLKESEQKYRELSIIDDLTQLYNSRHFHAQIGIEIERSNRRYYEQPLTLLLLDIDNFKRFNDTYGHVEGDYVLSQLGQVIKRCLRKTDSAYRYGGEEFTIMLPMTTIEEGIVTAKRIQTEIRKEAFSPVLGQEVYMTVSIGLAQYKQKEEMKAFVQRIDKLMYQAKKEGRNRICHDRIRNKHSVIGSN